jgi:hypothetical protein
MDQGTSMSDHEELDKRSEANKPDYQQTGLTRVQRQLFFPTDDN